MSYADEILQISRDRVEVLRASRGKWDFVRSLKALNEETAHEYEDRFVLELLQNAHDAQPAEQPPGRVCFRLAAQPGGAVLYVANTGNPFQSNNVRALADLARSTKPPGEGIGNKGLGFRSVLQVCDRPEIYSSQPGSPPSLKPDGFCFGFANDDDLVILAEDEEELACLRADVYPSLLPMPRDCDDKIVQELLASGFVTCVRLPLKGRPATAVVIDRLKALRDSCAPVLLFLDRLRSLEVRFNGLDEEEFTLTRRARRADVDLGSELDVHLVEVCSDTFALFSQSIETEEMLEVIRASVDADELSDTWLNWQGEARIAVAVPIGDEPIQGKLYTFLPMKTDAPFSGHATAPFYTKLARLDLNESVPLNKFLLERLAQLVMSAATALVGHLADDWRRVAADLLSWTNANALGFSQFSQVIRDASSAELPSLVTGKKSWSGASEVLRWPDEFGPDFFSAAAVSAHGGMCVLDPALGEDRLDNLSKAMRVLSGLDVEPTGKTLGELAELLASRLDPGKKRPLNQFYDELAEMSEDYGHEMLQGRRILFDQSGKLRRCGPWGDDRQNEKPIFSYPLRDVAEEMGREGVLPLPSSLAYAVRILHENIELLRQDGRTRSRTPINRVLQSHDLIKRYETEEIVRALGAAATRARSKERRSEILAHLYAMFSARELGRDAFRQLGVPVPTQTGWKPATEVFFGGGWQGTLGPSLASLMARVVDPVVREIGEYLLLPPADWPFEVDDIPSLISFLTAVGVRDGLHPVHLSCSRIEADGQRWTADFIVRNFDLPASVLEDWRSALGSGSPRALHPYTPYEHVGGTWWLPGHATLANWDNATRLLYAEVVAGSVGRWPEESLRFEFVRFKRIHRSKPDRQTCPSPTSAFLSDAEWIPVSPPGDRSDIRFATPRNAWHHDDSMSRAPTFIELVLHRIRGALNSDPLALKRLRAAGLRSWSDPDSALSRLEEVSDIIRAGEIRASDADAVKKAAREALGHLIASEEIHEDVPLIFQRGHRLEVSENPTTIYVPQNPPSFVDRIIQNLDLPILLVDASQAPKLLAIGPQEITAQLQSTSDVALEVKLDGRRMCNNESGVLLVAEAPWLADWPLLTAELSRNPFVRRGEKALDHLLVRFRRIRVVFGLEIQVYINDGEIKLPPHLARCVPLDDETSPSVVKARDAGDLDWDSLVASADAISDLLGSPELGGELRLSATELREVLVGEWRQPTPLEWAEALRAPLERVQEVLARARSDVERARELVVPAVYILAGPDSADQIRRGSFVSLDEFRTCLSGLLSPDDVARLVDAAQRSIGARDLRANLELDFAAFNDALELLGPPYEMVLDVSEHQRVIDLVTSRCEPDLQEALRQTFLQTFDQRRPLDDYVRLRYGPNLEPREADLRRFESPPEELVVDRIKAWLAEHNCQPLGSGSNELPPPPETRELNLKKINRSLPHLRLVVAAWSQAQAEGREPPPLEEAGRRLDRAGVLDFRPLGEPEIIELMANHGLWPDGMPTTTDLGRLGLSEEDLSEAALRSSGSAGATAAEVISVAGDDVPAVDLRRVADAIDRTVSDAFLRTSKRTVQLQTSAGGGARRSRGNRTRKKGGRRRGATEAQRNAIGFAGELLAYRWLRAHYPEEASNSCWVSSYREVLLGGEGDDDLGYDFIIYQRSQTIRFEVKATAGDELGFEMSENEVRVAQNARTTEPYRIIYIRNVLEPASRVLYPLPNPLKPEGAGAYRVVGRGLQFRFEL